MIDFKALPKIELHAHLTGSVSRGILHEIWADKHAAGETSVEDPAVVMPDGKHDYDLKTFFPLFSSYIYNLLPDAVSLARATRSVLADFEADGCVYLELRTTPRQTRAIDGTTLLTKEEYVRTVLSAIAAHEAETSPLKMHTRLILSVDRRDSFEDALQVVRMASDLRAEGGEGSRIVGVDLCGDPTKRVKGDERGMVADVFREVFDEAKVLGLHVTVHFAEAEVSGSDEELKGLLQWEPDRLGHVIWLSDEVKEAVKARGRDGKGIGLELCLSCNVLAGMVDGGFEGHHFGEWFGIEGCWVSLGTDDVGVFGSPLSNEYRLAAQHFKLSETQTYELARQGIESIFGGEEEKRRLRDIMWT